jgi:hypothetical protein
MLYEDVRETDASEKIKLNYTCLIRSSARHHEDPNPFTYILIMRTECNRIMLMQVKRIPERTDSGGYAQNEDQDSNECIRRCLTISNHENNNLPQRSLDRPTEGGLKILYQNPWPTTVQMSADYR